MDASVVQALADASDHHRRGRFAEAEAGYRRVLERAPDEPDALHRLGILARQTGRPGLAVELIERAIAADPRQPAYYNDAGIALHALGRAADAVARFRETLALKPDHVGAQNNLANILREQGDAAEAVRAFRKAIALRGDSAELWYNLGNALGDLRAFDDATEAYRRALALRPDFEPARVPLGDALAARGRFDDALAQYARALAAQATPPAIARFVDAFVGAELRAPDPIVRDMALRALSTPWARPSELAGACVRLLASDAAFRACAERADASGTAREARAFGVADLGPVLGNPLFGALLESTPVGDAGLERMLTLARRALLDAVVRGEAGEPLLPFCCALARQCFVNGYVFFYDDDEIARAFALRERVATALREGAPAAPNEVAVVAAYFPLHAMADAQALVARGWPAPLAAVVARQVREPQDEAALRPAIPRLTPIGDGVSASVRAQYEEHPYPRWLGLPPPDIVLGDDRGARALWRWHARDAALDILVAGCGTGQESIEFAQAFPRARVLAVDLSLASLAYAERKRRELGIGNLEHAQADLTRLAGIPRRFDLIASVGVLHHLAEPEAGLRVLADLLAPGGRMLVGLYSERGRADVVAARAFIAKRGYRPTGDDIRRCRRDLASSAPELAAPLARRSDFYATEECRDLLFHAQEHRFTPSRIGDALAGAGLRLDGFLLRPDLASRYAWQFPDDPAMTNLANFERFESEHPEAFAGMYIFWAGKAA